MPRLDSEGIGFWQKQLRNKKVTEAELREMVHPDSVDEIVGRVTKKASGTHDKAKIIESIKKSSSAAGRAAQDLVEGRISTKEFDRIMDQAEGISDAQRQFWKEQLRD